MLKINDKVKIVKKVEREDGWDEVWVDSMDDYIGKVDIVTGIDIFGINLENTPYNWPPSSLELVVDLKAE